MMNPHNIFGIQDRFAKAKALVTTWLVAGTLTWMFMPLLTAVQADGEREHGEHGHTTLVGTWMMQVGSAPGPSFIAYETFTLGGGSVEINDGPAGGTAGIGVWSRIAKRTFQTTTVKQTFDATGALQFTTKVRRLITLSRDGNSLTGRDNVDLYGPDGSRLPVEIPPATFQGARMAAEPLTR